MKTRGMKACVACIVFALQIRANNAFVQPVHPSRPHPFGTLQSDVADRCASRRLTRRMTSPQDEDPEEREELSLDELLDKPFFDPDAYAEDDTSPLGRLATFVKSDYELAETIFAGSLFVILLLVTQELLRMELYGDNYVPFLKGGASGKLF